MQPTLAKHTRVAVATAAVLLTVPLAACSMQNGSGSYVPARSLDGGASDYSSVEAAQNDASNPLAPNTGGANMSREEALASAGQATSNNAKRSVITTGSVTIEVKDPQSAVEEATKVAESLGGRIEAQSLSNTGAGGAEGASLTVRVPQDKLTEALDSLGGLGNVLDQSISADDVTAQHVDLQARVEALESSVARLTELMAGSATTSELIEAESALSARQAELDSLKAQLGMLEGQVDEATVWVSFTTPSAAIPGGPSNFWEGLLAGLSSLTAAGAGALVLLGILLPWLVIAAIITFAVILLVRAGKRRRAAKRAQFGGQQAHPQQAAQQQAPLAEMQAQAATEVAPPTVPPTPMP